jgi:beta-phosphoglucomutase
VGDIKTKAVIFDLDGVIVSTDEYHYQAWKRMADEEGIYFDRRINEKLRGISRMESLDIILRNSGRRYAREEKIRLAGNKNKYYLELLGRLTPDSILPGVAGAFRELRERGVKLAVGSSSRNAAAILDKIGLNGYFDAVVDGNEITHAKPDPEIFLLAAEKLGLRPGECVVVEDAEAGIDAARTGGMKTVGVGFASRYAKADYRAIDMTSVEIGFLLDRL